ncbi:unnamed protein product [Arabis nemorensis]|uniref:Uncharacterized protein n=1 Tax=Arabis nemorensis TaxID=586526 RepID=A0A565BK23_9BRAS|nr:unnamed protein product [Arabis nemorensis]
MTPNKSQRSRGVIASFLIKEEPPDAQIQPHLNHNGDLARGYIISRSKPFQEGEYDEDIKSSSTKVQGIMRHGEESDEDIKTINEEEMTKPAGSVNITPKPNQQREYWTKPSYGAYKGGPKSVVNEEIREPDFSSAEAMTWRPSRSIRGFLFNRGSHIHSNKLKSRNRKLNLHFPYLRACTLMF